MHEAVCVASVSFKSSVGGRRQHHSAKVQEGMVSLVCWHDSSVLAQGVWHTAGGGVSAVSPGGDHSCPC